MTATAQSGSCGDNVTWTINGETLTISGEGPMQDYRIKTAYIEEVKPSWFPFSESIKHVIIEPGVTSVGAYSFYKYEQLEAVTLPEGLSKIGARAFANCLNLTEIILPESLEEFEAPFWNDMEGCAFDNCIGLTSVIIPQNVKYIGYGTFQNCAKLHHVTYAAENATLGFRKADLSYTKPSIFSGSPIRSVEFTSTVKVIPPRLFDGQPLDKLKTGGNIEIVGENALLLSSPVFADVITGPVMIDHALYAYYPEDSKAFSLTLPEGTTSITTNAIKTNKIYLYELKVPESFYDFGNKALDGCTSLSNLVWNARRCNFNGAAPFGSSLFSVVLGPEVEELNAKIFEGCSGLKKLELPESLKIIEENALNGCSGLTELMIPDNVTTVYSQKGLSSLRELTIGVSVKLFSEIGGCNNLETVHWNARNCEGTWHNTWTPFLYSQFKHLTIGDEVESIPQCCFYSQKKLETIKFSNNGKLKTINWHSFGSCPLLKEIYLPEGLTEILDNSFSESHMETLFIPASLQSFSGLHDCTVTDRIIFACNKVPNIRPCMYGTPQYYVPDTIVYTQGYWSQIKDYVQPLVRVTAEASHEFATIDGNVTFDSKGLECNIPGYEVEFDFEANGTAPGEYTMVKATFSGANRFSAMIPFAYTILDEESSILSLQDIEPVVVDIYDMSGRPITEPTSGFYIEHMTDGTSRKIFRR